MLERMHGPNMHARCRHGAAKRDRRKLIIEENNGSSELNNDAKTKTVILERMRGPNMEGSLRRPKLAVVPHLCKSNQFNVSLKLACFQRYT